MKAKLKLPIPVSNKKDSCGRDRVLKKLEKLLKVACWLEFVTPNRAKNGLKYWCQDETRIWL
ncbi:hypothetical protein QUB70_02220 [Microcoleus sp. A003_D6]